MVTVDVPVAAVALAVRVNVLDVAVGFGANPAVTPLGRPEALIVTLPAKPFSGLTVIVLVPLLPCTTVTVLGLAVKLKSGVPPAQPGKLNVPMAGIQRYCESGAKVPDWNMVGVVSGLWISYQRTPPVLPATIEWLVSSVG